MPTIPFHIVENRYDKTLEERVEYLTNELAKTQKALRYLLSNGNIDTENVRELNAEVVNAGTLNTNLVTILSQIGNKFLKIDENGMVGNNGSQNVLNFDLNTGNLSIAGIITALAGMIGGWTIQGNALYSSTTTYPRIVIDPSNNELTFYTTPIKYVRIGCINFYGGTSDPYIRIVDGNDYVEFDLNSFYLSIEGTRQVRFDFPSIYLDQTVWADFNNLRDQMSGDSIWHIVHDLEDEIDEKVDKSGGITVAVPVSDGSSTYTLQFINGQLVAVI